MSQTESQEAQKALTESLEQELGGCGHFEKGFFGVGIREGYAKAAHQIEADFNAVFPDPKDTKGMPGLTASIQNGGNALYIRLERLHGLMDDQEILAQLRWACHDRGSVEGRTWYP